MCIFWLFFQKHIYFFSKEKKNLNDNIAKNEKRLGAFSAYGENDFSIWMQPASCAVTKPDC